MTAIYNCETEMSLRVILILNVARSPLSSEMIALIDFLSVYGKEFGLYEYNLNGDSPFMYSQMSVRHSSVSKALQNLGLKELIEFVPSRTKGYTYKINEDGIDFCNALESTYAFEYDKCARRAYEYVKKHGARNVQQEIDDKEKNTQWRDADD